MGILNNADWESRVSDEELSWAGLDDRQIMLLHGQPDFVRREVYEIQMRIMMGDESAELNF